MTPAERAAIRARWEAATPGPWRLDYDYRHDQIVIWCGNNIPGEHGEIAHSTRQHDAEAMAHAREDVLALLAALDAAEQREAAWKATTDGYINALGMSGSDAARKLDAAERRQYQTVCAHCGYVAVQQDVTDRFNALAAENHELRREIDHLETVLYDMQRDEEGA